MIIYYILQLCNYITLYPGRRWIPSARRGVRHSHFRIHASADSDILTSDSNSHPLQVTSVIQTGLFRRSHSDIQTFKSGFLCCAATALGLWMSSVSNKGITVVALIPMHLYTYRVSITPYSVWITALGLWMSWKSEDMLWTSVISTISIVVISIDTIMINTLLFIMYYHYHYQYHYPYYHCCYHYYY